jgi:hypothetical protein
MQVLAQAQTGPKHRKGGNEELVFHGRAGPVCIIKVFLNIPYGKQKKHSKYMFTKEIPARQSAPDTGIFSQGMACLESAAQPVYEGACDSKPWITCINAVFP